MFRHARKKIMSLGPHLDFTTGMASASLSWPGSGPETSLRSILENSWIFPDLNFKFSYVIITVIQIPILSIISIEGFGDLHLLKSAVKIL